MIFCHRKLPPARVCLLPGHGLELTLPDTLIRVIKGPKHGGSSQFQTSLWDQWGLSLPNLSSSPSCKFISLEFLHSFSTPNSLSQSSFTNNPKIGFTNYFLYFTSIPISQLYLSLNIRGSWLLRYSKARAHACLAHTGIKKNTGRARLAPQKFWGRCLRQWLMGWVYLTWKQLTRLLRDDWRKSEGKIQGLFH